MGSRSVRRASLLLLSLVPFAGCGGGGGGPGAPRDVTVPLSSTAAVDGGVYSDGSVFASAEAIRAGDTAANGSVRGSLRFLLNLPPGVPIRSALLRVHQSAVVGSPYVSMGGLLVEPVDFGVGLDAADFGSPALGGSVPLSSDANLEYKVADVTAAVQDAVFAGRPHVDFRLRFTVPSDLDGIDDHVEFDDAEDQFASTFVPELEVTYVE